MAQTNLNLRNLGFFVGVFDRFDIDSPVFSTDKEPIEEFTSPAYLSYFVTTPG